jgi:hypothetical protein
MSTMAFNDLESAYELLATGIDAAGEAQEALFFSRLTLLLAHELGDIGRFRTAIETALEGLAEDRKTGTP